MLVAGGYYIVSSRTTNDSPTNQTGQNKTPDFDKKRYSLEDPASAWVVVNKKQPLSPKDFTPDDLRVPTVPLRRATTDPGMQLRDEAASALERLVAAAKQDGQNLMLASGYRSYDTQITVYNSEVAAYGQTVADQESARPGHSEHQTGWAADLGATNRKCELKACFGDTSEGKWLAANAYKYGFIIRYTPDKTSITGYTYEPWHLRYIGTELATEMHRTSTQTLEEFFDLPAAANY